MSRDRYHNTDQNGIIVSKLTKGLTEYSNKLRAKPYLIQVAFFYVLMYLPIFFYVPIAFLIEYIKGPSPDVKLDVDYLSILVVAPLLETLVNQLLVFKLLEKLTFFKNRPPLIVFVSALLFSLGHPYSLEYLVFAFLMGIVLGYVFNFYRPNYSYAFWTTCFLHFLKNFTVVLLENLK